MMTSSSQWNDDIFISISIHHLHLHLHVSISFTPFPTLSAQASVFVIIPFPSITMCSFNNYTKYVGRCTPHCDYVSVGTSTWYKSDLVRISFGTNWSWYQLGLVRNGFSKSGTKRCLVQTGGSTNWARYQLVVVLTGLGTKRVSMNRVGTNWGWYETRVNRFGTRVRDLRRLMRRGPRG